jgi:hypothetical protein
MGAEPKTPCRKECGGQVRPMYYFSTASRLAVIPAVWWGIVGFGGTSGVDLLRDRLGFGMSGAAALIALLLAALSTAALIPCGIHRRILRRRAARCCRANKPPASGQSTTARIS